MIRTSAPVFAIAALVGCAHAHPKPAEPRPAQVADRTADYVAVARAMASRLEQTGSVTLEYRTGSFPASAARELAKVRPLIQSDLLADEYRLQGRHLLIEQIVLTKRGATFLGVLGFARWTQGRCMPCGTRVSATVIRQPDGKWAVDGLMFQEE